MAAQHVYGGSLSQKAPLLADVSKLPEFVIKWITGSQRTMRCLYEDMISDDQRHGKQQNA